MIGQLPDWFGGLATDLGIVAAVVIAIGVIYRGVVRPVIRYARRVESTIKAVDSQFRPNGGSSLRDAVDRIDARTSSLEAWRESVDTRLPKPTAVTRTPRKKATP
jgi:hypothetical protein